ncbi:YTH domain containing 1 isoform X2 [Dermatophagoides pteronyssinus]|uniref:YTH domain containing 1 isoform X2 n=1 Tax=Dermatophagoides pteronyssinus TaxID=6956 RepID=UPI003F67BC35
MMNEERNVLDDLLDNGDDEDFDAELKAARNFDRTRLATTTTTKNNKTLARNNNLDLKKKSSTIKPQSSSKDNGNKSNNNLTNRSSGNNGGGNNNDRKQRRSKSHESSQSSASCQSQYSCDSGSCSCEDHSSITGGGGPGGDDDHQLPNTATTTTTATATLKDKNNDDDDRASNADSNHSYQSFTRSPSLKIKITKNSDSRTVAKSTNLRDDLNDDDDNGNGENDDDPTAKIGRKRKHGHDNDDDNDDGDDGLKRSRRHAHHRHHHRHKHHNRHNQSPSSLKKNTSTTAKKRDYSSLIKYFFKDSCYFVMKSNNEENVEISKREGVWSTPLPNEMKLNSAFREFRNVILIFSVKESGKFQGFARLSSEVQYDLEPVKWVLPPGIQSCPFGGIFFIDWICRNELPFTHTSHLYNAFNESKPVKIARDGQEIEPKTGEELCRLFPADDFVDLIPMLKRMKKQTLNRPRKRHSRGPFMDSNNNNAGSTTTTTRHDSYRNKTSLHLSSSTTETTLSLHSIKKRLDYPDGFYSNRIRDDRYNRTIQPRTRSSDNNYGSMNGYHSSSYRTGGYVQSNPYPLDNGNHHRRYSSTSMTLSSSYSSGTASSYNNNHHHHHNQQQQQYRTYSSNDGRQQQLHRDHYHHHRSGLYRDRY